MRNLNRAGILICLAAQAVSVPIFAGEPPSSWTPADPAGAVSDDNPATVDRIQFGNQFQNQGMDQWCDDIPLIVPLSQDFVRNAGQGKILDGGIFSGTRQFLRYPNGSVALNDELEIKFQLGYTRTLLQTLGGTEKKALGVFGGASIDGQSIVTRPLHTADSCSKVKRLLTVLDFKTVLPLNADRISNMEVGELWEIPLVYQIAFEPMDAGNVLDTHIPKAPFAAYLSIGLTKTSDPTVTLFRRGPHELRLKIHFDQFRAVNASGGAILGPIPPTDIGTAGVESVLSGILPNLLSNPVLKLFSRLVDDYLAAQLSVLMSGVHGRQIFLEYVLDPADSDQMRRLAELLKGDLGMLKEMQSLLVNWKDDPQSEDVQKTVQALRERHTLALRVPETLAGLDSYKNSLDSFNFSIPMLVNYRGSQSRSRDHYVIDSPNRCDPHSRSESVPDRLLGIRCGQTEEFISYKAQRQSNWGFLKPPLLGSSFRRNQSQSVQVLFPASQPPAPTGVASGPIIVYNRESGILRSGSIGDEIERINSMVSSIGSLENLLAPSASLPASLHELAQGSNHKGYLELSVILTPQAIHKILAASALSVIKAFQLSLEGGDRKLFDYALKHATILSDGTINLEPSFSFHINEVSSVPGRQKLPMAIAAAHQLCAQAKEIIDGLGRALSLESSPEAQAKELFQLLAGKTHWYDPHPDYRVVISALLRLAPLDGVAADVVLHIDKEKTSSTDPSQRFLLNPQILNSEPLRSMSSTERAFIPPTALND